MHHTPWHTSLLPLPAPRSHPRSPPPPLLQLINCGLSEETVLALEERGIHALFPIQKLVFAPAMEGSDLIGRAKTGSGKTLAFALPVVEKILAARRANKPMRGRAPQCIVLAPTRELAKQVCARMALFTYGTYVSLDVRL